MQCDLDQRDHLVHLAGLASPPYHAGRHVRPGLVALGNKLLDIPVIIIITDLGEVFWCNGLGRTLLGDFPERPGRSRNIIWQWFVHRDSRPMPADEWSRISAAHVTDLRATYARRRGHDDVTSLVEDLLARSDEFRELWERHDVSVRRADIKSLQHPEVGTPSR